jgi:hypothetical protein
MRGDMPQRGGGGRREAGRPIKQRLPKVRADRDTSNSSDRFRWIIETNHLSARCAERQYSSLQSGADGMVFFLEALRAQGAVPVDLAAAVTN